MPSVKRALHAELRSLVAAGVPQEIVDGLLRDWIKRGELTGLEFNDSRGEAAASLGLLELLDQAKLLPPRKRKRYERKLYRDLAKDLPRAAKRYRRSTRGRNAAALERTRRFQRLPAREQLIGDVQFRA